MAGGAHATRRGKRVAAAFRDAFGFGEALPRDLALRWQRVQFCATFGWTFAQYDALDVRDVAEAAIMLSKAANFRAKVELV